FNPDLIYFLEAKLTSDSNGILKATPVKGNGSGDFVNLVYTDGFLRLPQGKNEFKKGEVYPFLLYRKNL
ncbi:MAG: molybdopterin molybdenumtransferase MoeA, partial [Bacteroidota bacterium]